MSIRNALKTAGRVSVSSLTAPQTLKVNGVSSDQIPRTKGSIRRYFDVWCGGDCAVWEHLEWTYNMREAAAKAREKGWKLTKTHGWLCPYCAKKEKP